MCVKRDNCKDSAMAQDSRIHAVQERLGRTWAQMEFKGAGPHDNRPLSVDDDSRPRALVHAHKLAHSRDDIGVVYNMPRLGDQSLVLPETQHAAHSMK